MLLIDLTDDALEVVLQFCSLSTLRTARAACQRCARLGRASVRSRQWQERGDNLDELRISMWSEGDIRCAELSGHIPLYDIFCVSLRDGVIASASRDGMCKLWDAASGSFLRTLCPKLPPAGLALHGTALATGRLACGDNLGTIHVWDLEKALEDGGHSRTPSATLLGHRNVVSGLAWAGETLLSGGIDRTLRVWDVDTRECIETSVGAHLRPVRSLAVDGGVVASGGDEGTVKLWSLASGRAPQLVRTRTLKGHEDSVMAVALRGPLVLSGSIDHTVRLWDARTGGGVGVLQCPNEVYALTVCGHALVSGGAKGKVSVHDMRTMRCVKMLSGHMGRVSAIAAEGGRAVSGDGAGKLRRWELTGT